MRKLTERAGQTPEGDALDAAILAAGNLTRLAARLKIDPQVVSNWRRRGRVSAAMATRVQAATGVPVWRLRPDFYPRPARP